MNIDLVNWIMNIDKAYQICLDENKRIKEYEPFILQNTVYAYMYALNVIKGRWPEAEPIILEIPYYAYLYAKYLIKDRWLEAEPFMETSLFWKDYCKYFNITKEINWKLGL